MLLDTAWCAVAALSEARLERGYFEVAGFIPMRALHSQDSP